MKKTQVLTALAIALAAVGAQAAPMAAVAPKAPVAVAPKAQPSVMQNLQTLGFAPTTQVGKVVAANQNAGGIQFANYVQRVTVAFQKDAENTNKKILATDVAALIAKLDANGDGKISNEEIASMPAQNVIKLIYVAAATAETGVAADKLSMLTQQVLTAPLADAPEVLNKFSRTVPVESARGEWMPSANDNEGVSGRILAACAAR